MPSTWATCIIASGPLSSPVGKPSPPSGTPGWSMPLRSQPMAASAALLQLMMWPLAWIMPTGRVGRHAVQVLAHHALGAAGTFFGRLEDQVQRAAEAPRLRQVPRRRQQRGGVAVVAAGVHLAVVPAGVGQPGGFGDGQCVHVGADADAPAAAAVAQAADHAGAAQAALHLVAPGGQALGHQVAGGVFLEGQLRMLVDVVAQADHLGQDQGDLRAQGVHVHGVPGWAAAP